MAAASSLFRAASQTKGIPKDNTFSLPTGWRRHKGQSSVRENMISIYNSAQLPLSQLFIDASASAVVRISRQQFTLILNGGSRRGRTALWGPVTAGEGHFFGDKAGHLVASWGGLRASRRPSRVLFSPAGSLHLLPHFSPAPTIASPWTKIHFTVSNSGIRACRELEE